MAISALGSYLFEELALGPSVLAVLRRLNEVPGLRLADDRASTWTSFPMAVLAEGNALDEFLGVWDWYIGEIRAVQ